MDYIIATPKIGQRWISDDGKEYEYSDKGWSEVANIMKERITEVYDYCRFMTTKPDMISRSDVAAIFGIIARGEGRTVEEICQNLWDTNPKIREYNGEE